MPQAPRIASRQHPIVRRFRRAAERRDDTAEILLDGEHLIRDAIAARIPVHVVLTTPAHAAIADTARAAGATVHEVTAAVIDAASPVRAPSGVVALAAWSPAPLDLVLQTEARLLLGLVDVQDPGNVGSVIRAADALGAGGVLVLDRSADPAGWKALRGAMGSTFRVPVARGRAVEALAAAAGLGWQIAATAARQPTTIEQLDWSKKWLVLLGNEGAGLPDEIVARADVRVSIAMRPEVESLNVAVTAALIAAEARRV
jgi:TrmH family RNA methyltransferase